MTPYDIDSWKDFSPKPLYGHLNENETKGNEIPEISKCAHCGDWFDDDHIIQLSTWVPMCKWVTVLICLDCMEWEITTARLERAKHKLEIKPLETIDWSNTGLYRSG